MSFWVLTVSLPDDVPLVVGPDREYLNQRQREDYKHHRQELLEWLYTFGKDPQMVDGYSHAVTVNTAYRLSKIYRWLWDREGYTTQLTHDNADAYLREIAGKDWQNSNKAQYLKALKRLFKWREHERGEDPWEAELSFYSSGDEYQPQDFFTLDERKALRQASLEYGSVPAYSNLTPDQRMRWKQYISVMLEKPMTSVTPSDWDRMNDWKIPSLVATCLDTGLRPIEVERAVVSWVDVENAVLRIPKEESSKNRDNWIVGLRDRTARALSQWLAERVNYPRYDGRDELWLTRRGNPYQSASLNHLLSRLCEEAGIPTENRRLSWYSIRHSVGTYMTHFEDLGAAKAQLRHRSERTTLRYDNAPIEQRRGALDKMG